MRPNFDGHGLDLKARHHCTDVACCLLFAVVLCNFAFLFAWCQRAGDVGKLFHGIDYKGQICGVDPQVVNEPYLYWCPSSMAQGRLSLNLQRPICVTRCPAAGGAGGNVYGVQPDCADVSGPEGMTAYASTVFLGSYCVPHPGRGEYKNAARKLTGGLLKGRSLRIASALSSIPRAWPVLMGVFFLSMVVGYVYLLFLRMCAETLIWVSMGLCVVGFGCLGNFLWLNSASFASGGLPDSQDMDKEQENIAKAIACACWLLAFAVVCLACCVRHSVAAASACVEMACDEMFQMPSLLVTPACKVIAKACLCAALLQGFLLLLSTADTSTGAGGGLVPTFNFTREQYITILYYMLVSFWLLAFVNALYQFTVAYAVAEYYYTEYDHDGEKDVGCCAVWDGLHVGLQYHTGSLAFGSLLIATLQVFQKVLEYAERKNKETADNHALSCILCCCACCVHCCEDVVEIINKNAYIDMAVTSNGFCAAARDALAMIVELGGAMAILNGATFVFTIFGTTIITLVSGWFAYVVSSHGPFADQETAFYVNSPDAVMVFAMIIGFLMAMSFMDVFDMTSDTLLYCYGIDLKSGKGGHTAPPALRDLVHSGEHGDDPAPRH